MIYVTFFSLSLKKFMFCSITNIGRCIKLIFTKVCVGRAQKASFICLHDERILFYHLKLLFTKKKKKRTNK